MLFIRELAAKLNQEDRRWRHNTLIFWDGAPYHKSRETMAVLEELQMPIMVTGPYSYDVSPCETFFAHFKRVNINPRKVATGKR